MQKNPLKIGYLMQADSVQMSVVSGPQMHVKAVVQGFSRRGHQVRMVAIQQGRTEWTDDLIHWHPADQTKSSPFRILESILRGIQARFRLPFLRLFDSYHFSDACVAALGGYDILYERFGVLSYGGVIAARRLGIPIVLELNGDLLEEWIQLGIQLSRVQWWIINFITRLMYQSADRLVPVSENLAWRMIERWQLDSAKVIAVPNGADVHRFVCPPDSKITKSRYSINGEPIIVHVSSFYPWHGIDLLLEAFAHLISIKPRANLVLVGEGMLLEDMQIKAISLGIRDYVIFTGLIDHAEVASLLSIADLAVICHRGSQSETALSPLKLFEYMAAGKAIIAPAIPNIEQILTHRVSGFLIPPGDPDILTKGMVELLEDDHLRASIGEAARKKAIEKHSWSNTVAKLETILYDLVHEQKA